MDPDDNDGEGGPLVDLVSLLGGVGFGTNDIAIQKHPSRGWGMHASCDLVVDKTIGGGVPACGIHP